MQTKSNISRGAVAMSLLALPVAMLGGSLTASAKDIEITNSKALAEALKTVAKGDVLNLLTKEGKDWAGSTGLAITLPEGVTLNGNGVTLHAPIKVAGDNVTINNVVLQGSDSDKSSNVRGISIENGADNVTIADSTVKSYFRGVSTDDNSSHNDIRITGNTFDNNRDNDVLVWANGGNSYEVSGNTATNVLQVRGNSDKERLSGVKISKNTVTVSGNATAIMTVYTNGAEVSGNTVNGAAAKGALVSLSGANDLKFVGNTLTGGGFGVSATLTYRGKYGNETAQVTDYAPVRNITFTGNTITGSTNAGVRFNAFDGATFAQGNTVESKGNAIQIVSQSFKADNTNKGELLIDRGNKLTGAKAVAADQSAKFDKKTSKLVISEAAVLNGKTGNAATLAGEVEIPTSADLAVEYKAVDGDKEVTEPVETNETKKADVTAPNTGTQNVVNAVLVASTVAAMAVAGAFVCGKLAKDN